MKEKLKIIESRTGEDFGRAKILFNEYLVALEDYLCSPNLKQSAAMIHEEIKRLPGPYDQPDGCLLVAAYENILAGCAAIKKLEPGICELKRMYVRPQFRGKGVGKALAMAMIQKASERGYARICLCTLSRMREALLLYRSLGFSETKRFARAEPCRRDDVYMQLMLRGRSTQQG